jgi:hypothetical protein
MGTSSTNAATTITSSTSSRGSSEEETLPGTVPSSDYEIGSHATHDSLQPPASIDAGTNAPPHLGAMVFQSGGWKTVPGTSVVLGFYTVGSAEHGYLPNQLHEDWVSFHANATAREVQEMAQVARTIPAYNSSNKQTMDVLAYSGYAGLGLFNPSSKTYFGDLRQTYGVDWEVLSSAGLTVAMVGYGNPHVGPTKQLLNQGSSSTPGAAPLLVCGDIGGTQAQFAAHYEACDGAMEYDGSHSFDDGLGFYVPPPPL